jgi:hypothetical protein
VKVTADTITDKQIRQLREDTLLRGDRCADLEIIAATDVALWSEPGSDKERRGRARCAEIWNACHGDKP